MIRMWWTRETGWQPAAVCDGCGERLTSETGYYAYPADAEGQPTTGEVVFLHHGCPSAYAARRGAADRLQNGPLPALAPLLS